MNKHIAKLPNGKIITRNSKTRTYTHVVIATDSDDAWGVIGWCGRLELAHKTESYWNRRVPYYKTKIIEAELI